MKKLALISLCVICAACSDLFGIKEQSSSENCKGYLVVYFDQNSIPDAVKGSGISLPDTNDFILSIADSNGKSIYTGKFGAAPESLVLDAGTYIVNIVSCEFSSPLYDCPQYGDNQTVLVKAGATTSVRLECSQQNAGMKLILDQSFKNEFQGDNLYLKAAEGTLLFAFNETRTAYFKPGNITVMLDDSGTRKNLVTRNIQSREILRLKLSASAGSGSNGRVTVSIDTSRVWNNEELKIGESDASNMANAYSISEARQNAGKKSVWVYGYIVGGDLTSSKFSYTYPFTSRTNIVLASRSACIDKSQCFSVQLNKGEVRDALNLVDNPGNLGKQVYIKGDIISAYYGITGMENVSDMNWK